MLRFVHTQLGLHGRSARHLAARSADGIVAKIREYAIVGPLGQMPASDRQPKQLIEKLPLSEWITFAHPSGSPLPNHVDRLDSRNVRQAVEND
jgi:hypothetical protein